MVENMLDGIEVELSCDYLDHKEEMDCLADKVIYTGPIDAYFHYDLGPLEYRMSVLRRKCWINPISRGMQR